MIFPECGKCAECPAVVTALQVAESFSDMAVQVNEAAMDKPYDQMGQEAFSNIPEGVTVVDPITMKVITEPADAATYFRMQEVKKADRYDMYANESREVAQILTDNCPDGQLKMRAKRAGRTITVTVCASIAQPDGIVALEPANVIRS